MERWAGLSQGFQVVPVSTLAQWAPGPVSDLHQCKATGSQLISVCLSSRRGPSAATHHRSETADPLQLLPFQGGSGHGPFVSQTTLAGHQIASICIGSHLLSPSCFPLTASWSYLLSAPLFASFTQGLLQGDPAQMRDQRSVTQQTL